MISPIQQWVAERTGLKEKLAEETLKKWQLERVIGALEYARSHSKFYAGKMNGISTEKIKSIKDMQIIPFTRPEDIISNPKDFVCVPQKDISRIITMQTSGSSGMPKRICFTANDIERTVDFFAFGMSTMVHRGQKVLVLMSGRTEYSIGDLLKKGLNRIEVSTEIHGNVRDVYAAAEAAKHADCLVGVPGEIIYMCRTDESLRPESVLLSADYVPESVIKAIENTWKCHVYTHYGMTEAGFGCGVQCRAGEGYHLRDCDLMIEIIDQKTGLQAAPGEYGEVVITTFFSEAMPLIRYRTGDIARMETGACSCGGILPRLDKVTGRQINLIPLNYGEYLSINELDEILYAIPEVCNFRASIANKNGDYTLKLMVDANQEIDRERILLNLKKSLTCNVKIQVDYGKVDPFTGTEKRHIIVE